MSAYLVNLVDGLTSLVVVWGGIAWAHHTTCDCRAHQDGRLNHPARFLPGPSR